MDFRGLRKKIRIFFEKFKRGKGKKYCRDACILVRGVCLCLCNKPGNLGDRIDHHRLEGRCILDSSVVPNQVLKIRDTANYSMWM